MIIEHVAKAHEAISLALKRCKREQLENGLRDALESARDDLHKALDELKAVQGDDRKFYDAILKYSLSKKAELGDSIADILRFLGQDR